MTPVTEGKTLKLKALSTPGDKMAFVCVILSSLSTLKKAENLRKRKERRGVSDATQGKHLGPTT